MEKFKAGDKVRSKVNFDSDRAVNSLVKGHVYTIVKTNEFDHVIINNNGYTYDRNSFELIKAEEPEVIKEEGWGI